jgi:rod shape-determining protein MreC
VLSFLSMAAQRLVGFLDRRRGVVLAVGSVILLGATVGGVVAVRPPLLAPAIEAVEGALATVVSQPARIGRYFRSPRASQERLVELELELARLRAAQAENRRLRAMLEFDPPPEFSTIPARIIALDLDPLTGTARIDAGRRRGVLGGEPVVTPGGLVGVVDRLEGSRARVRLLVNPDSPVGVRDTRSRVVGTVEWSPGRQRLEMKFVPVQADVAEGDTLVSSGLGGMYPPELPVGVIERVTTDEQRLTHEIVVRAFARFGRLDEVLVIQPRGLVPGESGPAPAVEADP